MSVYIIYDYIDFIYIHPLLNLTPCTPDQGILHRHFVEHLVGTNHEHQDTFLPPPPNLPPLPLRRLFSHQEDRAGLDRGQRRRQHLRVHAVHPDGVDLEGRHRLQDQRDPDRIGRVRRGDHGHRGVGRANGRELQLLREGQPGPVLRPRPLPPVHAVLPQPDLRRAGPAPRVVLQLRRGLGHRAAHGLRPAEVHRGAVARHRRRAVPALRGQELLPVRVPGFPIGAPRPSDGDKGTRGAPGCVVPVGHWKKKVKKKKVTCGGVLGKYEFDGVVCKNYEVEDK